MEKGKDLELDGDTLVHPSYKRGRKGERKRARERIEEELREKEEEEEEARYT